ncbi:Nucleoside-diphosphate-sugar epimerase [Cetobacterium ceti]|uniref:Nucleoside-diphosphate-sugar epimerase n=1 Tax=Cetobacterium ceti TaxID=180163 RepID=A0A1T4LTE1_9FUSO|nr:NAD-dependent epimerase/dehydratase family protein [Cetobacterium ceti]SJZ57945.1 Nucleoside-diphosphate-sugar epimerase [Cetobacterium ceti]
MKVLITGATGFIGSNFIKFLSKKKHNFEIITLNRDIEKANKLFGEMRVLNLELNNSEIYKKINEIKPTIIINFAAYLTSKRDNLSLEKLIEANISYPTKLLNSIEKGYLKYFFNFGSFAEYMNGTEKLTNAYLYSATKSAFRNILDFYSELLNFNYFNLIPYTVYGENDTQKKVIDYIIESLDNEIPQKMSPGEQVLDFIHINDLCEYIYRILQIKEKIPNKENLFLGTGKGVSIKELAKLIEQISKKKANIEWGAIPYREKDIMHAVAPVQKNYTYLKWLPKITLDKGVELYWKNK